MPNTVRLKLRKCADLLVVLAALSFMTGPSAEAGSLKDLQAVLLCNGICPEPPPKQVEAIGDVRDALLEANDQVKADAEVVPPAEPQTNAEEIPIEQVPIPRPKPRPSDLDTKATAQNTGDVKVPKLPSSWGGTCKSQFAKDNGKLGPLGELITTTLNPETYPGFFGRVKDVELMCPGFRGWNTGQKKSFWVYAMASMAFGESGCNQNVREHQGPNGTLKGIMQLHKNEERSYTAGKAKKCRDGDSKSASRSIICSLGMMENDFSESRKLFQRPGNTYWAMYWVTLGEARVNCKRLQTYPGCGGGETCKQIFEKISRRSI